MSAARKNIDPIRPPLRESGAPSLRATGLPTTRQVLGSHAVVTAIDASGCRLDDGRRVALAAACLLQPRIGDRVLVTEARADLAALVLAVLERAPGGEALLNVPGTDTLRVAQRRVAIEATEQLALRSLKDAELTAATGTLSVQARNLFTTVLETLVERAADHIAKFGNYALDAAGLLRMRAHQGIVTADKQLRLDADQMHLG